MLTEDSGTVLRREREVPLRKEPKKRPRSRSARPERGESKAKGPRRPRPARGPPCPLFEALRAWRAEQAREQGVPAYVIFHDATLREIAAVRPGSVAELGGISGVGEKKLVTYGEGVLGVVAQESGTAAPGAEPATGGSASGAGSGGTRSRSGPVPSGPRSRRRMRASMRRSTRG